jgi:sigma-B regulation protein RsbU (phosphoserine phosphatase)
LPSGRFGFILGDVAGKGSPAALLAAVVLGMFSAEAFYQESAASLVTRLNRGLFHRGIEARFLTAFYGMLATDGSLTYSNAGHNAPMLVTGGGVRRLETGGLVLGLFEHVAFEQETVVLRPGDTLIVFSDGVSEALNEYGDELGDERLLALIDAHKRNTPQALLDALLAGVRAFCGRAAQGDDVTMLIVRFEGPVVPTQ